MTCPTVRASFHFLFINLVVACKSPSVNITIPLETISTPISNYSQSDSLRPSTQFTYTNTPLSSHIEQPSDDSSRTSSSCSFTLRHHQQSTSVNPGKDLHSRSNDPSVLRYASNQDRASTTPRACTGPTQTQNESAFQSTISTQPGRGCRCTAPFFQPQPPRCPFTSSQR